MDNLWFPISFLFNHSSDKYIPEEHSIAAVFSAPQQLRRDGGRPLASQPRSFSQRNPLVIIETTFLIPGHIHIYIYLENRMDNIFLSTMGFTRSGFSLFNCVFLFFDCEGSVKGC